MIDKNLKVLDLADGVEKLANISSFDVNSTITDSDLMLIEQSTALKKVTIGDLKTEIGTPTGTPDTIAYFDSAGDLASDVLTFVDNSVIAIEKTLRAKTTLQLGFDKDENAFNGVIQLNNENTNVLNIDYSLNSDRELNLSIENTKATLEDGDILVYNETNSTFKVDNISNYVGGGNTYTISLPFSKGGGNVDGTVTVPTGAVLLNLWLKINTELSTGGAPFQIRLDGSTPFIMGEQGVDFTETVGVYTLYTSTLAGVFITDPFYEIQSADSGILQANHSGSGYGDGIIYLQYSTALS